MEKISLNILIFVKNEPVSIVDNMLDFDIIINKKQLNLNTFSTSLLIIYIITFILLDITKNNRPVTAQTDLQLRFQSLLICICESVGECLCIQSVNHINFDSLGQA